MGSCDRIPERRINPSGEPIEVECGEDFQSQPGLNIPNPYQVRTGMMLVPTRAGHGDVAIFNISGRRIRTLAQGQIGPEGWEFSWDGRTVTGETAGSGIYFVTSPEGEGALRPAGRIGSFRNTHLTSSSFFFHSSPSARARTK